MSTISHYPSATSERRDVVSPRGWVRIGSLALLIGILYYDQILRMVRIWSDDVDWSHGFLVVPFCLYLVYSRRRELSMARLEPNWLGLPLILLAIAGYVTCIYAKIGYPQPLSMLPVIAGTVLLVAGWDTFRITLFPILFIALAMKPPDRLYKQLTQPLQQFAAMCADGALRFLPGVEIERNGIGLIAYDLTGNMMAQFTVAGACSGMNSLLAFTAIGLAMAFFNERPMWHRVVMVILVVPVALFCNVVRVLVTGTLMIYGLKHWAEGTPHMVLGLLTFALGMAIYSGVLYVLDHLMTDDRDPPNAAPSGVPA